MRYPTLAAAVAGTVLAALAGSAAAVNCYEVLDRNDNVVYRGSLPPVDMSDKGAPEREAMRARGQHLIAMNVERCLGVEYFTGAAGTTTLSVDQIVGGIPTRGLSQTTGGGAAVAAPQAAAARAAAASSPPRSSMSGSGTRTSN
jgi:hypothetical protein